MLYPTELWHGRMSESGIMSRPRRATPGATAQQGVHVAYAPLRAGDDVLTIEHDHYSTHESLRLATLRRGATLRKVALYTKPADATTDAMAQAVERAIAPATRVVAITWVHSSTGVKTPVR